MASKMAKRCSPLLCDDVSSDIHGSRQSSERNVATTRKFSLCSLKYRFRIFKSKGAVLVLMWSFSGLFVLNFLIRPNDLSVSKWKENLTSTNTVVMCSLLYPIFGLLADVYFGRYKVVKWSIWIMWMVAIFFCATSAGLKMYKKSFCYIYRHNLRYASFFVMSIGLGGFQANIIQLGIDQLIDASSCEITSFLRWYTWLWFLSKLLVIASQSCFCGNYQLGLYLLLPAFLTVAVALDYILGGWLVKEPTSNNPIVSIAKVLYYAIKNKYPRQRSAFTYWDDKPFTRIDLGKSKYGGPFTTEEVENVKTFWRILAVIIGTTIFAGIMINSVSLYDKVSKRLNGGYIKTYKYECGHIDDHCLDSVHDCFRVLSFEYAGECLMIVMVPLFEFVFYPIFKRDFRISILKKILAAMFLNLVILLVYLILEVVGQHQIGQENNSTTCFMKEKYIMKDSLPLSYKWIFIPGFLTSISFYLYIASAGEFICAQSPYSMKGFLFGLVYGLLGLFSLLGFGYLNLITLIISKWTHPLYGCGVWYLVSFVVILFAVFSVFYFLTNWYKKRLRDDNQHNEQIFAIDYYS